MGRFTKIKQLHCKIKKQIIEDILGNQELLKYIYYSSPNPTLEQDIENTISLINTYVFKRSKDLFTDNKEQNYVFVRVKSPSGNKGIFKDLIIQLDIICHVNLQDNLDDGSDRALVIVDYLDEMFDDKHSEYWVGGLQFDGFNELFINNSYSGYRLQFKGTI